MPNAERPLSAEEASALKKIHAIAKNFRLGDRPSGSYILNILKELDAAKEFALGCIVASAIRATAASGPEAQRYYKEVAWYAEQLHSMEGANGGQEEA